MELRIHRVDRHEAIALCGPIVFRVVRTAPTELEHIDDAKLLIDEILEHYSNAGAFVVVEHNAPVPSAGVRRYGTRVFGAYGDRLTMCHIPLGLGFWATAARIAISAITKLTGSPSLSAGTVEDGAMRLANELIGVDPDKIIETYTELVTHMDRARTNVA